MTDTRLTAATDRFTLLTVAIAALGAGLVLGREFTFGAVFTPDSASYISAARSLLAGEGLLRWDGNPYISWPPLYPLLLAAASLGIFDPIAVAGPLNAVIFGLTIFIVGRYLRQRLASRFLAAWSCLATALAVPLVTISSWALTETLLILLTTLALIQTDRFLTEGKTRTLVWAAVFSALALQSRYIGVVVPVFIALLLLFQRGGGGAHGPESGARCRLLSDRGGADGPVVSAQSLDRRSDKEVPAARRRSSDAAAGCFRHPVELGANQ